MTDLETYAVAFALATVLGVTALLGAVYCVRAAGRRLRAWYGRRTAPVAVDPRPSHLVDDTPAQAAYREKLKRRHAERRREPRWPTSTPPTRPDHCRSCEMIADGAARCVHVIMTDAELHRLGNEVVAAAIAITRSQANGGAL